jgi:hypothetical protein
MNFDLRYPLGALFLIFGAALMGYGIVSDPAIYQRSLGINVNLRWGAVLALFGCLMIALARRGTRKR